MKKILLTTILSLSCLYMLSSCFPMLDSLTPKDKVLVSLGEYKDHESYSDGVWQDFTFYRKYYFDSVDFEGNEYFTKVGTNKLEVIDRHLDDFEKWIETIGASNPTQEVVVNYDFDRSLIDEEDYIFIISEEAFKNTLTNYDIYFFDTQSNTLYYFHNNI